MLGDSFKKGASTFDGFMDGVFGKKVVDKAGKLQNKSKVVVLVLRKKKTTNQAQWKVFLQVQN